MADGRMLKRAISNSRRLSELKSDGARLLYTWIIPWLDVEGRFSANPAIIKGNIVPRLKHFTEKAIETYLQEMHTKELITLYEIDGDMYLELRKFHDHQNSLRREAASTIPPPGEGTELVRSESGDTPAQGKRREGKRREENPIVPDDSPVLPPWLPPEDWAGYAKMRERIKKPLTPRAVQLAINKLDKFRQRGINITEVLNASEYNEWQDLYEPKGVDDGTRRRSGKAGAVDTASPAARAAAERANDAFRRTALVADAADGSGDMDDGPFFDRGEPGVASSGS